MYAELVSQIESLPDFVPVYDYEIMTDIQSRAFQSLCRQLGEVGLELENPSAGRTALGGLEAEVVALARRGFKPQALMVAENLVLPLELFYRATKPQIH